MSVYLNFYQQNLYKQHFDIYPNVYQPIVRGESDTESSTAFMYYENKMYKEAQNAFESLLKEENNPNIRFYYALSFLNEGNTQQATEEFDNLKNIEFEFKAETYWYHALALIKLEKYDDAKVLLEKLKAEQYEFNKDKVEPLLEALD